MFSILNFCKTEKKKLCRDKIKPKTEVTLLETIVNLGMRYKTFYMLFIVIYDKLVCHCQAQFLPNLIFANIAESLK